MADEAKFERMLLTQFNYRGQVEKILLANAYVGSMASATVFIDAKGNLMTFIASKTRLKMAEVQKIISRMGMKGKIYLPPLGDTTYFNTIAREKFETTFPGKRVTHPDDLAYYRTLVPYNPALVVIGEVKGGVINVFDSEAANGWRPAVNVTFKSHNRAS
jgi:hypothetical protein